MMSNDYSTLTDDRMFDLFDLTVGPWSCSIAFGLGGVRPGDTNRMLFRGRVPLSTAKALAVMLLRLIRQYEDSAHMTIELPPDILAVLGIPPEDWRRFTG